MRLVRPQCASHGGSYSRRLELVELGNVVRLSTLRGNSVRVARGLGKVLHGGKQSPTRTWRYFCTLSSVESEDCEEALHFRPFRRHYFCITTHYLFRCHAFLFVKKLLWNFNFFLTWSWHLQFLACSLGCLSWYVSLANDYTFFSFFW